MQLSIHYDSSKLELEKGGAYENSYRLNYHFVIINDDHFFSRVIRNGMDSGEIIHLWDCFKPFLSFSFSCLLIMSVPHLETIEITLFDNGVAEIAHNRPKRYNALSPQSYRVKTRKVCR